MAILSSQFSQALELLVVHDAPLASEPGE